jgi:uncharacterized protein (DUF927 family)
MGDNIFKEINQRADIKRLAEAYGFKIDKQDRINCFMHNDKEPSLKLHTETNTWWCYACGEGYTPLDFAMKKNNMTVLEAAKEINKVLGLNVDVDKFNPEKEKNVKTGEYFYRRANGTVTMKVEKWVKQSTGQKEFYPYALIDGKYVRGYAGKLKPEDCVLYNLPEVLKSDIVYFTEGEKDADTLKELGIAGTTTPGGGRGLVGYAKKNPNLFKPIENKEIRIISDNDDVGSEYIKQVVEHVKDKVKNIKVFNLCDVMPHLKKKGDISDVKNAVGKEKTLEFLKILEEKTSYLALQEEEQEDNDLNFETREDIFNIKVFERLYQDEINADIDDFMRVMNKIKDVCQKKKYTGFSASYKLYKDSQQEQYVYQSNFLTFSGLNENNYNTNRYELSEDGVIYENIPNVGRILVCYHPIVPIQKYKSVEDGIEKIKLAYYTNFTWNYVIVDKSVISSTQSIIRLSDLGIAVNSENAKYLIKYLTEIENLNKDKIKTETSVSRLGWIKDKLIPYDKTYEFDNAKDLPRVDERFGVSGELKDWIEFFKERRKTNNITRIIMAGAVASILLKELKQNGFTIHIFGESGYGKTLACMVGQSIFGNPSQNDSSGIGINFNFTNAGLEYRLNLYNDIPLFINEMQLQKDAKDYDKMLFMIESGKGKSRATKIGGIGKENSWNNIVITNGEKNIVKTNSDNGAYNRCLCCEILQDAFDDPMDVADFVKENYGSPIREILKHLKEYDIKQIFQQKRLETREQSDSITEKQKTLEAIIMTGDKILTDIIFKDEYYLTIDDFENKVVKKKETAIEERAYEVVKDWTITKERCFLSKNSDGTEDKYKNIDIYGREMAGTHEGYMAFLIQPLKKVLEDNGFDYEQIIRVWKRKGYTKCDKGKNQKNVRILGNGTTKCIMLNMEINNEVDVDDEENDLDLENMELPF